MVTKAVDTQDSKDKKAPKGENTMKEKIIEQKLIQAARQRGGIALKFVSPAYSGMPDRLVLMPGARVGFVEVKAPGTKPRPLQVSRHAFLRQLGFQVYVLDDPAAITRVLNEIGGVRP